MPGLESLTGVEEPQGGLSQLSAPMMDEGVHFSKAQRTRRLFYSRGSPWSGLLGSANRASTSHSWGSRVKRNLPVKLFKGRRVLSPPTPRHHGRLGLSYRPLAAVPDF